MDLSRGAVSCRQSMMAHWLLLLLHFLYSSTFIHTFAILKFVSRLLLAYCSSHSSNES